MNQTIDTVISELASRLAELVWTEAITQARDSLDTLGPKGVKLRKLRPAIDGGQRMEREEERTQRLGAGMASGTPVTPVRRVCVSVQHADSGGVAHLQIRDIWEGTKSRDGECTYTLLTRASTGGTGPTADVARAVIPFSRGWWR